MLRRESTGPDLYRKTLTGNYGALMNAALLRIAMRTSEVMYVSNSEEEKEEGADPYADLGSISI